MDRGYEKERFTTISFKRSTAKKFRAFSRKLGKSNSMALSMMVDFFQHNKISPKESMGPNMRTLESLIKKRNNAVIAIMKNIEKDQTKPAIAILQSLLEGGKPEKKPLILEKKNPTKEVIKYRERNATEQ
ncbi:hypothetical protein K8352_01835 [Flavobacteriaceae bacterium F89]|uniref:Uncharacterized protein n=1 Tax=Cerina litoralis TaxID=2874477 RepID=A0AAE3ES72_9FLAO|nr:BfmA/BtgA family mobilization protein [Cerina litoralis]MCG2459483.1 hypothetical protein [Cerina litoralis]